MNYSSDLNFLLWCQSSSSSYLSCMQHGLFLPRPCAGPWHTCSLPGSVPANNFQTKFWNEGVPGTILHRWIGCSFWSWWVSKQKQVIAWQLASAPGNVKWMCSGTNINVATESSLILYRAKYFGGNPTCYSDVLITSKKKQLVSDMCFLSLYSKQSVQIIFAGFQTCSGFKCLVLLPVSANG